VICFGRMDLTRYSVREDFLGNYHFFSEGSLGTIHKAVRYLRIHGNLFNIMLVIGMN
jgi:hypothetical protein